MPVLGLLLILLLAGGYVLYRAIQSHKPSQLMLTPVNFTPEYQPPDFDEKQAVETAKGIVDWQLTYREYNQPYPTAVRCELDGSNCQALEPVHRDGIVGLWTRNLLYQKTHDATQLRYLTDETDYLNNYMNTPSEEGFTHYWQAEFYHCYLIDQILTTNQALSATTRDQLSKFCGEASNEIEFITEVNADQLERKIAALTTDEVDFDWASDPTVETFEEWALDRKNHQQNILLLADQVVQEQYPAIYEDAPIESFLDSALTSYAWITRNEVLSPVEKYYFDLMMILNLKTLRQYYPDNFPSLAPLLGRIETRLYRPGKAELEKPLRERQNLKLLATTCFLENVALEDVAQDSMLEEIIADYHSGQSDQRFENGEFQPISTFYKRDNEQGGIIQYNIQSNNLAAGCLIMN